MSISAISSNNLLTQAPESLQSRIQQFQKEFQQLGQDLHTGNLIAAQQDYASIRPNTLFPAGGLHHHSHRQIGSSSSADSIAQDFAQLGQALSAGDLTSAQQAYALLQQDLPVSQLTTAGGRASANDGRLSLTA